MATDSYAFLLTDYRVINGWGRTFVLDRDAAGRLGHQNESGERAAHQGAWDMGMGRIGWR